MGYIQSGFHKKGTEVEVEVRKKLRKATVKPMPYAVLPILDSISLISFRSDLCLPSTTGAKRLRMVEAFNMPIRRGISTTRYLRLPRLALRESGRGSPEAHPCSALAPCI